jgi:ribosomal RNA-processing protein 7
MSASVPTKVQDFAVLSLALPPLPSYPKPATHYIYLRPDASKSIEGHDTDTPRSLFVANIPIDSTEAAFRNLFKSLCGARLERVDFEGELRKPGLVAVSGEAIVQGTLVTVPVEVKRGKKRKRGGEPEDVKVKKALEEMELPRTWDRETWKSGSNATVVFVDQTTRDLVLKECRRIAKRNGTVEWHSDEDELGEKSKFAAAFCTTTVYRNANRWSSGYRKHHSLTYPPKGILQHRINTYLTHFTKLEAARTKLLSKQRSVPDEDGFVTVTRGGRAGPARLEEAQAAAERLKEREKKRVGGDFYRFQTREGRKLKERELKDKYEEDKKRIQSMRERRGKIRPE